MFAREIIESFRKWAAKDTRKPLVLRGARQVGKTTSVNIFAKDFDQYIYLNLERKNERALFENDYSFNDLLMALFLHTKKIRHGGKTLIFIDEIQNSSRAISLLRYFYEGANDLYVIAAGSLLETILDRKTSFPVGRVEYMVLHPVSFKEFLCATDESELDKIIEKDTIPEYAHDELTRLFRKYLTIGGMPQVVEEYIKNEDISALQPIYESLILSYIDNVEKYAPTSSQIQYIRHIISTAFVEAGNRIKLENFGNSTYRYREMKEAFTTIEKTMLFKLVYPSTECVVPALPNLKRKPRLHTLDTGLINFSAGIFTDMLTAVNVTDVYRGKIAEHIVGQELLARSNSPMEKLKFWVKNKKQSQAEIDYIISYRGLIIPIEVKSGSIGKLRSLHQFMDMVPHQIAVRVWQGKFSIEKAKTIAGKEFILINLPFYMVHRIEKEIDKCF
jgi:predicted AAA+ superfamily ATPase